MIDRYYMAFISSTTHDLQSQRIDVFRSLINEQWMPVSMESFPPGPKTLEFIYERMRICDAIVLILNNHYGERVDRKDPNSASYTQLEYDFAAKHRIPIIALVNREPENHAGQSEKDWKSFLRFRKKVTGAGHIVGMWSENPKSDIERLSANLRNGLLDLRKKLELTPKAGWIRANEVPEQYRDLIENCQRLGIDFVLSDANQRQPELKARLASATKSIKIFSTTAEPLIRSNEGPFTNALCNGADIQVLVAQPGSEFIRDVEEIESMRDHRPREIQSELQRIQGYLQGYLADAKKRNGKRKLPTGTVEVRYYSTHFRSTMILCDKKWGKITLTIPPKRATTSASFEVGEDASHDSLLLQCHDHFMYNWRIAKKHNRVAR
jgi:hypothetical protein